MYFVRVLTLCIFNADVLHAFCDCSGIVTHQIFSLSVLYNWVGLYDFWPLLYHFSQRMCIGSLEIWTDGFIKFRIQWAQIHCKTSCNEGT